MKPVPPAPEAEIVVEGQHVRLHNLHKVFWPELGLTKADLVNYYLQVSPYLLPYLKGRPFIMKPFPDGASGRSYYRWEIPDYAPAWVHRWRYQARTEERTIDMVVVEGLADLVWVVNQACIEMHPWLSRRDDPLHPDVALLDLDPGPGTTFTDALQVAAWLHQLLERAGTRSYAKTSGRKGVHVLVPLERRYSFREVRDWVKAVARRLAEERPHLVTAARTAEARRGRVLVDYAQNGLGKSVASPYSARATRTATVSTPLTWAEVEQAQVRPEQFTLLTVPERLGAVGDLLASLAEGQLLPDVSALGSGASA